MKIKLIWVKSAKEDWLSKFIETYEKKISDLNAFEIIEIKSPSLSREQKELKVEKEGEQILRKISERDFVVTFHEKGKIMKDSQHFSQQLVQFLELGKPALVFIVGGAFGLSSKVLECSQAKISLSNLTYSHQVALAVGLEQIYRALSIRKGIPYHNN